MKSLFLSICLVFLFGCSKKETVEAPKPLLKTIVTFSFLKSDNPQLSQDVIGQVSYDSVYVEMPPGSQDTSLIPTITFKGSTISPASKTAQNFTNAKLYTIKAEDATSRDVKVVVRVLKSPRKEITSFVFKKENNPGLAADLVGWVKNSLIEVECDRGADLSHLMPTISHNGVAISPDSIHADNFANPVYYTVVAEDGSTKTYTVLVTAKTDIYVTGTDGYLYDFDAKYGSMRWRFYTGGSGVPVYDNGVVFAEGANHIVYALHGNDGSVKWTSTPPAGDYYLTQPVAKYGRVYFGGGGSITESGQWLVNSKGFVYCLNQETGLQEWLKPDFVSYTQSNTYITNIAVEDNMVYLYDVYTQLFAYNADDGSPIWMGFGELGRTSPAVSNGIIYNGVEGGLMAARSIDGQFMWRYYDGRNYTSPSVGNGFVFTTADASVLAFQLDGTLQWSVALGGQNLQCYASTAYKDMVFVPSSNRTLFALSAQDGSVKWSANNIWAWPVVCNEEIFTSDANGRMLCLDAKNGNIKWYSSDFYILNQPYCVVDANGKAFYSAESGGQN